jgi:hypothetical protein
MTVLDLRLVAFALAIRSVAGGCSSSSPGKASSGDGGGGEGGASFPTIAISSPMSGATVTVTKLPGTEEVVPISFSTTNIMLMTPGACPASLGPTDDSCGHVHLLIDGAACTPGGQPYNNATPAMAGDVPSPVNAIVTSCPMVNGAHTVTLELHHDDHSSLMGADGKVISTQVMFTASGG